jgi:hypothetical protein
LQTMTMVVIVIFYACHFTVLFIKTIIVLLCVGAAASYRGLFETWGEFSSDTPPHFFHLNSCPLDFFQEFSSTTSKVLSTNIPCINCTTMRNAIMRDDMSLVTLSHRVLNFHTPFRHGISSTYITTLYGCSIQCRGLTERYLWSRSHP